MKKFVMAFATLGAAIVALQYLSGFAWAQTPLVNVRLQPSTPGAIQNGHLSISGTAKAGNFSGAAADFLAFRLGNSSTANYVLKADSSGFGTWQADSITLPFSSAVLGTGGYLLDIRNNGSGGVLKAFSIDDRTTATITNGLTAGPPSVGRCLDLSNNNNQSECLRVTAGGMSSEAIYAAASQGTGIWASGGYIGVYAFSSDGTGVDCSGDIGLSATGSEFAILSNGLLQTASFKMPTGASATYVLTSDVNGVGTWQPQTGLSLPYSASVSSVGGTLLSVTNTATTGTSTAIYGRSDSGSGRGVSGFCTNSYGVYGESVNGVGVRGFATAASGTVYGLYGLTISPSGVGVYGQASASSGTPYGVRGFASTATTGYAVYAAGDMGASGTKSFVIDHPFDPKNKYLKHYCTEGPEPYNVYSGSTETDANGVAWVELPEYFSQINKDPKIQLTVVDEGDSFVLAKVWRKVHNDRFAIKTSEGHVEVNWEVRAIRNDMWMRVHGAPVVVEKQGPERGKYQHPELYGQPKERGIDYRP